MDDKEKNCTDCTFLCFRDSGYSNWTVTETYESCLKGKFTDLEDSYPINLEDTFYKEMSKDCEHFQEGVQARFDVDGKVTNEDYKDSPILYQALLDSENK